MDHLREHHLTADLSMPSSITASSYGVHLGGCWSGNGTPPPPPPPPPAIETATKALSLRKAAVRYRECLKNHAASIGGHSIDGCGEFMPSGEDGTMEALRCAACNCHRNFHRREVEGEQPAALCTNCLSMKRLPQQRQLSPPLALPSGRSSMLMALNSRRALELEGAGEEEQQQLGYARLPVSPMKKRFRTKFSVDQKEKMCVLAEKLGWRIQKQDEIAVQQFCADVGVKRHVLKVWMHNNKHTFGKKLLPSLSPPHHHHQQLP